MPLVTDKVKMIKKQSIINKHDLNFEKFNHTHVTEMRKNKCSKNLVDEDDSLKNKPKDQLKCLDSKKLIKVSDRKKMNLKRQNDDSDPKLHKKVYSNYLHLPSVTCDSYAHPLPEKKILKRKLETECRESESVVQKKVEFQKINKMKPKILTDVNSVIEIMPKDHKKSSYSSCSKSSPKIKNYSDRRSPLLNPVDTYRSKSSKSIFIKKKDEIQQILNHVRKKKSRFKTKSEKKLKYVPSSLHLTKDTEYEPLSKISPSSMANKSKVNIVTDKSNLSIYSSAQKMDVDNIKITQNSDFECSKSSTSRNSYKKQSLSSPSTHRERIKSHRDKDSEKVEHIVHQTLDSLKRKKSANIKKSKLKQTLGNLHSLESTKVLGFSKKTHSPNKSSVKKYGVPIEYSLEQKMDIDEIGNSSNENNSIKQKVMVVVDTNVLLEDRLIIDDLRQTMFYGEDMKIIIPFMVLQELDKLKTSQGKEVETKAQSAIKWCNTFLENEDPCIQGQDYELYLESLKFGRKSGDDLILACCLSFSKEGKLVYLVSNDVNLRNKAFSSKIKSISSKKLQDQLHQKGNRSLLIFNKEIANSSQDKLSSSPKLKRKEPSFEVLNSPNVINSKTDQTNNNNFDVKESIVKCLGGVLEYAMKEAYDDYLWKSIVLYKPPWSAVQVLKCFEKHWIAVFMDKFSDDIKLTTREICQALENKKEIDINKKLLYLYELFVDEPYKSIVSAHNVTYPEERVQSPIMDSVQPQNCILKDNSVSSFDHIQQVIIDVGKHASDILKEMRENLTNHGDANSNIPYHCEIGQSLQLLRTTLVSFGYILLSLKNESDETSAIRFKQQVKTYWELAQKECPPLDLSENDLIIFSVSVEGKRFLEICLADLEKLIQNIDCLTSFLQF